MVALVVSPTIQAASIGIPDTLFLMLLALVVFGPRRLPEIGRQIGKLMYEFRKVSNDFKYQMEEELRASEEADRQKKLQAAAAATPAPPALEPGVGTTIVDPAYSAALAAETASETPSANAESAPAVEGEVRGDPHRAPQIQPPATGETIAAQKPFRGRIEEPAAAEPSPNGVGLTDAQPEAAVTAEAGQETHHG